MLVWTLGWTYCLNLQQLQHSLTAQFYTPAKFTWNEPHCKPLWWSRPRCKQNCMAITEFSDKHECKHKTFRHYTKCYCPKKITLSIHWFQIQFDFHKFHTHSQVKEKMYNFTQQGLLKKFQKNWRLDYCIDFIVHLYFNAFLIIIACKPAYGRHMLGCQPLAGTAQESRAASRAEQQASLWIIGWKH